MVSVPKTHPLFVWDDVRNNLGFDQHLDIDADFVLPFITHDDPNEYKLVLCITNIKTLAQAHERIEHLWDFCNNPKKKPLILTPPPTHLITEQQQHGDPLYAEYADKVLVWYKNTILYIPGLEESFSPRLITNILTRKHCNVVNRGNYCKMTPDLWEAIKQNKYTLLHIHPNMDAEFYRYEDSTHTRVGTPPPAPPAIPMPPSPSNAQLWYFE